MPKKQIKQTQREVLFKLFQALGHWPDEEQLDWIILRVSEIRTLYNFAYQEASKNIKKRLQLEEEHKMMAGRPLTKYKVMDHSPGGLNIERKGSGRVKVINTQ